MSLLTRWMKRRRKFGYREMATYSATQAISSRRGIATFAGGVAGHCGGFTLGNGVFARGCTVGQGKFVRSTKTP